MLFKYPTLKKNQSEISTHAGSKSNCSPEKQFSIFLCPYPRFFFFIKKNNLQVGVSEWRGGVQIRKSMALYVYVYQDACKCIL